MLLRAQKWSVMGLASCLSLQTVPDLIVKNVDSEFMQTKSLELIVSFLMELFH